MKNKVRFWQMVNGDDVLITLKRGQTLSHYARRSHEEGWSSEGYTWEFPAEGDVIYRQAFSDGVDCDGRMTRENFCNCPISMLTAHEYDGKGYPKWELDKAGQRDYSAEAMGY